MMKYDKTYYKDIDLIIKETLKETLRTQIEKRLKESMLGDFFKDKTKEIIADVIAVILKNDEFLKRLSQIVIHQIEVKITPKQGL